MLAATVSKEKGKHLSVANRCKSLQECNSKKRSRLINRGGNNRDGWM